MYRQRQQTFVSYLIKQANPLSFLEFVRLNCNENQVAQSGQNSLLECALETSREVKDVEIQHVAWTRYYSDDREPQVVLEFKDGRPNPIESYSFAEPFWSNRTKNVSMLITNVAVEHEGAYECKVTTNSGSPNSPKMTSFKVIGKLLPEHHFLGRYLYKHTQ